jgi:chorismate mutase
MNEGIFHIKDQPLIIAGPCSAETEEQVLETANRLKKTGKVDLLRAGIWKPRTSPGSFEGVGEKGLPWLVEAKNQTGIPTTVEVANAKHVELCLNFEIDVLWIGARTTVNPFAVQEIADALRGVDIPVMVKNPINPDLALWLGSVERIKKAGIKNIAAIHRGFSNLAEKYYRNRPQWQIAIEFMRQCPEIPIICDPSHICGRRDILKDVSQKALDLDYDGLMIESHITPDDAWSDAAQQITPEVLADMLDSLIVREDYQDNAPIQTQLEYLRKEIDNIDDELVDLLNNRMKVAREIGQYKKENNITILQSKRWNEIINRVRAKAEKFGLGDDFVLRYLHAIHDESINQQEQVMKK